MDVFGYGSPTHVMTMGNGMRNPVFMNTLVGVRKQRGKQAAATRRENQMAAAAAWAASADVRPYSLTDLADGNEGAHSFFKGLSMSDMKMECATHGLKITGAKYKLFDSLLKHARATKFGNPDRGEFAEGRPQPVGRLKAGSADKVRRALVADLRKGLVFDKKFKFKKGVNKMLSARYANCSAECEPPSPT